MDENEGFEIPKGPQVCGYCGKVLPSHFWRAYHVISDCTEAPEKGPFIPNPTPKQVADFNLWRLGWDE